MPWFRTPESLPPEPVRLALNGGSPQFQFPAAGKASRRRPADPSRSSCRSARAPRHPRPRAGDRAPRSEVCGFNEAAHANDGQAAAFRVAHVARQGQLGLHVAFDELRARSEAQAQAAAWWLRVVWAREGGGDTMQPCAAGTDCPGGAPANVLPPVPTAVDALAQLALASQDAVGSADRGACVRGSDTVGGVQQPAAAPLGHAGAGQRGRVARAEHTRHRPGRRVVAARAARAALRHATADGCLAWVLQAMPERAPPLQRYAAWQRAEELERAADAKALAGVARHCSDSARRDSASRAQTCEALARWLQPEAARNEPPSGARAYDCPTIERQWREARDAAQRGVRMTAQAATAAPLTRTHPVLRSPAAMPLIDMWMPRCTRLQAAARSRGGWR